MYTDINGQTYKLKGDKAIIQHNETSVKIEIFPTVEVNNKTYEVVFPNNCNKLFYKNTNLQRFIIHELSNPTTNITTCKCMFGFCSQIIDIDLSNFNTKNVTNMLGMFCNCTNLIKLDLSNFNTKNAIDMTNMFSQCINLHELNIFNFNTKNVTDMSNMFYGCINLIELDLSNFNTKNVTDMSGMFYHCTDLIKLDLSKFNTKNVTDMSDMFGDCNSLKELNLSNFNTENITKMELIFTDCTLKQIDLSKFDCATNELHHNMYIQEYTILANYNCNKANTMYINDINCNNKHAFDVYLKREHEQDTNPQCNIN